MGEPRCPAPGRELISRRREREWSTFASITPGREGPGPSVRGQRHLHQECVCVATKLSGALRFANAPYKSRPDECGKAACRGHRLYLMPDRKPQFAGQTRRGCNQRWLRWPIQIVLNVAQGLHLRAICIGRLTSTDFARARDDRGFRSGTKYTDPTPCQRLSENRDRREKVEERGEICAL